MTADPVEELFAKVRPYLDKVQVLGARLLIATWERPEAIALAGGHQLYLPDKGAREEDRYQGKVGLVVKLGPLAFQSDDSHEWRGVVAKEGDWVAVRVGDTWPLVLGDQPCRLVEDVRVQMVVSEPDVLM